MSWLKRCMMNTMFSSLRGMGKLLKTTTGQQLKKGLLLLIIIKCIVLFFFLKLKANYRLFETRVVWGVRQNELTSVFEEIAPGTLVYSAYYDNITTNTPFIRLIAVADTYRPPKIFCHKHDDNTQAFEAELYKVKGHWRRKYSAYIVSCSEVPQGNANRIPKTISVSTKHNSTHVVAFTFHVRSTNYDNKDMKEYAVCLSPIWGNRLTLTNIIEFIELNRLLGASMFFIYIEDVSKRVLKGLKMYEKLGVVKLIRWKLPSYMNDEHLIHFHGQQVSIHDCLYRSRLRAKWVGFHDFDEFLVPFHQPTIPSLLNSINHEASGFCLQSVALQKKIISTMKSLPNETLITQKFLFRDKKIFPKEVRSKCIVNPRKIFEMAVHYIERETPNYKLWNSYYWIDPQEAVLFHYRNFGDRKVIPIQEVDEENFMVKFKKTLTENVDKMMRLIS